MLIRHALKMSRKQFSGASVLFMVYIVNNMNELKSNVTIHFSVFITAFP